MKKFLSMALAGLVLLGGCTSVNGALNLSPSVQSSLTNIGTFTMADLQNADKIALAQTPQDQLGHQCFVGLEAFVTNAQAGLAANSGMTVSGAFSALEAARAAANTGSNAISPAVLQPLELACGPLVIDVQNTPAVFLANLAAFGVK